jgi:hypothetical protein
VTGPAPRRVPNRATNRTGYGWSEEARRYVDPRGRFVSRAQVKAGLDEAVRKAGLEMQEITAQLRGGVLTVDRLAAWEYEMRARIKDVHLYSAAAARGGWDQMTPAMYGRVGAVLSRGAAGAGKGQFQYLEGFLQDLISGRQKMDGSLTRRAAMYATAARGTYAAEDGAGFAAAGYDEERNIRNSGDSCDGCVGASARGWVPIGQLPPIGSRTCLGACLCRMEYRKSGGAGTG